MNTNFQGKKTPKESASYKCLSIDSSSSDESDNDESNN